MVTPQPFALTPGHVSASVFIDYTAGNGIKMFKSATEKLDETFDGDSNGINLFNKKILEISNNSGWTETWSSILMINYANGNPGKLIDEYGRLIVEEINNNTMAYIGQNTRKVQKSVQMYHCISNPTTKAAPLKIVS